MKVLNFLCPSNTVVLICFQKKKKQQKIASFSLAEARMASDSNFTQQALETVETATFKLRTDTDNVAGVLLPVFKVGTFLVFVSCCFADLFDLK